MANTVPAKYTVQIGPTVTPEVGGEIFAWAQALGISASSVARECLEEGLAALRRDFRRRAGGDLNEKTLAHHVAEARERGDRQVQRRLNYDKRRREADVEATNA